MMWERGTAVCYICLLINLWPTLAVVEKQQRVTRELCSSPTLECDLQGKKDVLLSTRGERSACTRFYPLCGSHSTFSWLRLPIQLLDFGFKVFIGSSHYPSFQFLSLVQMIACAFCLIHHSQPADHYRIAAT